MNKALLHIIRFAGLLLLQVWVLNNVRLGGYINPFVYIMFVMMLPFTMPGWLLLIAGFMTGFIIDLFMSTPGLHAGATVFLAFMRPHVVRLATGSQEPETISNPNLSDMGMRWWFSYSFTLVLLHHLALFTLESFSFKHFGGLLLRIILSAIFTQFIIILLSLFFEQRKKR
jgi:hypothetical protein